MNDSSTKIIIFPLKGTRLLKETANSRIGTEKINRGSLEYLVILEQEGSYQRLLELYQMDFKEADETV